ncbi:GlxA family transcriptional regulator [Streptomonospora nanhaiensis]|uniref:Transcriptional regulator GlxA family with amidase domain n=1 Tax=Streptomonospora nanhaiensis TaxID=1323731 RepID=A0A853BRI5_9ACTN|nr:GlxA family transcriptional regulator [Streptomonospora nanhaiensis]MBV2366974.1 GlxA family transcriptional regulator [Streptomonospora nanhaiensis]MBX9389412.1 GlxA family transcriptional regulator [Streptomonospora nanhaiensis]NYI96962.1 transcriptional regulator GlxA family with amidase domain [Streptomonospora nanhaiensis]
MRRVVLVVFERFQLLDLSGPADVFASAGLFAPDGGYRLEAAAVRAGTVRAHGGIAVHADTALREVTGPIDTLLVAGGFGVPDHLADRELVAQVARLAGQARRVASVCNGAFLLAEAGLLAGRRATTHWWVADDFARRYPATEADPARIYIRDGDVWTSAGVTSGIDLALALVADDHGHELAARVARALVVYLHRPGGQDQFSLPVRTPAPRSEPLRELKAFIDANPGADLRIPALAARAAMSERHFSRVFTRETGMPPGAYVERSRADAARRLLETTAHPLDRVARESGLGSPETLYRVFRRHWRISPGDYRRRFQAKEN